MLLLTSTRNGHKLDSTGLEIQAGDIVAYKAKARSNVVTIGVILKFSQAEDKYIQVVETGDINSSVPVVGVKPKYVSQISVAKINNDGSSASELESDLTKRSLSVGDYVAFSDYDTNFFSFGRVAGFSPSKKKNVLIEKCSLANDDNDTDMEIIFTYSDSPRVIPCSSSSVVKVNGAEVNWKLEKFDESTPLFRYV